MDYEGVLRRLQSGEDGKYQHEYLPVKKWPKGYLESDGMGTIGIDVSKGAPGVIGAMNAGGGKAVFKVTEELTEKVKDKYRLAIDCLISEVRPWYPASGDIVIEFKESNYFTVLIPKPLQTSGHHALNGVAWSWAGSLKPSLVKAAPTLDDTALAFLSHYYAGNLDKHKMQPSATYTLRVVGYKLGMNGWLDGLPTHYYLSADSEGDTCVGVLVFTVPTSEFRRMMRRVKGKGEACGKLFYRVSGEWKVDVLAGSIGGHEETRSRVQTDIPFKPHKQLELYDLQVASYESNADLTGTSNLVSVLQSVRESQPPKDLDKAYEYFHTALLSVKTPKLASDVEAPPAAVTASKYWEGNKAKVEESSTVEFKTDVYLPVFEATMRKTITAMLNTGCGGVILYGIDDSGRVSGLSLSSSERDQLLSTVKQVVNGIRPIPPEALVATTFHNLQVDTPSANWWETATAAKKPAQNKCVLSIAVGKTCKWPFHLCGPKSGIARVRRLASSDVMSESEMVARLVLWKERFTSQPTQAAQVSKKRKR